MVELARRYVVAQHPGDARVWHIFDTRTGSRVGPQFVSWSSAQAEALRLNRWWRRPS